MAKQSNPPFMSGVPELLVLQLLSDREMYGYELVQAIQEVTRSAIALGEGVVYPVLYALEAEGALKSRREIVKGRTRIYYRAVARGHRRLERLTAEWERVTAAIGLARGVRHA